ncbi:MAG TPA: ABC transporter substrate-binding protein [Thermoanaerobaculia bacterium]|nr:ABC transporter substrate-binding protein [Thermoanaerobaculia bacterium]
MRTTRRDFLGLLLGAGALAGFADPPRRAIRIAVLLPPGSAAGRGAELAVDEARRAAELLGTGFELVQPAEGALAIVGPRAGASDVPYLVAGTPYEAPAHRRIFQVASSLKHRGEALIGKERLQVVDWHPDLVRFGAEQLNQRYSEKFGEPMKEAAWRSWMAVKIAAEAALRSPDGLLGALTTLRFDGHKGTPLWFHPEDHHLVQPMYLVDGKGKMVGEVEPEEEG